MLKLGGQPGSSANVAFLDAEDEYLLVKLYISKVGQLCGHFRFPEEVEATAITYLKRFYLKNTVMDWHPKNVMCDDFNTTCRDNVITY
jgi:cyclin H